jgi:hypothetical protein
MITFCEPCAALIERNGEVIDPLALCTPCQKRLEMRAYQAKYRNTHREEIRQRKSREYLAKKKKSAI